MRSRFDLETALAAWRHSLAHNRTFLAEDVDELERHVRDQVMDLMRRGWPERAAFARALGEMGTYGTVETEYQKVYWGKRRRRRELLDEIHWRSTMLKNYLTIAYRTVLREKGYALINVVGLAVGLAVCALIFLFVRDELTFDRFHERPIYRVQEAALRPDGSLEPGGVELQIPLGPALKADIPGIAQYVRLHDMKHYVRSTGDAIEETVLYADAPFLEVFSFPLQAGDPGTALADPGQVVLTEATARKYFGDEDPMGRLLQIRLNQTYEDFVVAGVAADPPGNSTVQFGIVLPFDRLLASNTTFRDFADSWHFFSNKTFVTLNPGQAPADVAARLPDFFLAYHEDDIAESKAKGLFDESVVQTYRLQPITSIHLDDVSSPRYSYILAGIALAILLIACINFMTLSVGRSARRAREVGVRKVVGARRGQLMAQFWGEALLLSALALLLALGLTLAFLPTFNQLADKHLALAPVLAWPLGPALLALVVLTALVAGSYPALVLSGFHPIETLSNRLRLSGSNAFLQGLVVLQFALSVFLITSTVIMARQLNYARTMDLGFDKEHVVVIPTHGLDAREVADRFRNAVGSDTRIADITAIGNTLGNTGTSGVGFGFEGKKHTINVFGVETNTLDFLGLDLVAGRNFDPNLATDTARTFIVNEALVRDFDLTDPIGKGIPGLPPDPAQSPLIIGVVKDFNHQSLYKEVGPMIFTLQWGCESLLVRIRPTDMPGTIDLLKTTWQAVVPDLPFAYSFLDDAMQAQYGDAERWSRIVRYATLFAVLIACLGLVGLAALSISRRTKEIGIRKVLGASTGHVVVLIARGFALLVVLGVLPALPVAYFVMRSWLDDFAYRIPLSWTLFAGAGLGVLGVALLAVSYQAARAALSDPVHALRYE